MLKRVFFFLIIYSSISFTQVIKDLIQPVNLLQDEPTKILISDIFYSEDYSVTVSSTKNIKVTYNDKTKEITFIPDEKFSGIELISFKLNGKTFQIPVKLTKSKKYLFIYKPKSGEKEVNLFGQFNSWDRQNLPMKDVSGDGILKTEIPLDPGRYEYKYFVDGKEIVDPENPVKVPNGMGDYNSLRIIEESAKDKIFLHVLGSERIKKGLNLEFYFSCGNGNVKLKKEQIVALIDNEVFQSDLISINGNKINLLLKEKMLNGNHTVRIAVNYLGNNTNIQTIRLFNGALSEQNDVHTLNDNIIYCLMVDRFCNGDTSNDDPIKHDSLFAPANYQGGDLKGIINKIQDGYFDKLGVNALWISPIVDNTNNAYREYPAPHRWYTGYHGYWPVSSTKVEEHFGNMNLAREIVNNAHNKNIRIFWDYVAHHVHQEHWMWKDHRDWFGTYNLPNGRLNLRLWDEYRLTTWFEPYMPSFDYTDSYEALEYMTDNAVWWLKVTGADGFRHDAVKHVPNKYWRLLTKKIKSEISIPQDKEIYQIGETFGGIDLIASYVNNGQLNAQFNFNLYDVAIPTFLDEKASFKLLDYQMQKSFQVFGNNNLMGNIMDSHDKIRYMAYADGDLAINDGKASEIAWNNPPKVNDPKSYDKLKLHLAYILTIPGIPIIYYGDEIGMTGASDPDNRRMMRFDDQLNKYEKQTLEDISKLIHIRKDNSALRYGDFLTLQADENIYAYLRSDMNERVLIIINKNHNPTEVSLPLPEIYKIKSATDLVSKKDFSVLDNEISLNAPGFGYLILILKK